MRKPRHLIGSVLTACVLMWHPAGMAIEDSLQQAAEMHAAGAHSGALDVLSDTQAATATAEQLAADALLFDAALLRVDTLRSLGQLDMAVAGLSKLRRAVALAPGAQRTFAVEHQRALLLYSRGNVIAAAELLEQLAEQQSGLNDAQRAALKNDSALIQQRTGDLQGAAESFAVAADLIGPEQAVAARTYRLNQIRALLDDGELNTATGLLNKLSLELNSDSSGRTTQHHVAIASLYRKAVEELAADVQLRVRAYEHLQRAAKLVQPQQHRMRSYINGYLGALFEDEGRARDTLHFSRKAVLAAQVVQAHDVLYRWEWQLGRSLAAMGSEEEAAQAYARAIDSLRKVRTNLESSTPGTFRRIVAPIFYQYAEVLLTRSAALPNGADKQTVLRTVRDALEEVKLAEVQDYFENQCVVSTPTELDQLAADAAVLYPVLLDDRIELLLTTKLGIEQFSVPVSRIALTDTVRDFRLNIEVDTGTQRYLELAQRLHAWLIQPIARRLEEQNVRTLVIVPDGPLRTIPLAALHDGADFLVEGYAVATTPGLTLLDPQPLANKSYTALVGGVSESVQGFSALPSVSRELQMLNATLDARVYQDAAFTLNKVQQELAQGGFAVAHFATHGQFRGNYRESFLLTHDDKMTLDLLGSSIQSRGPDSEPLELLVLSACETAAGDDRAALGLAGVAIKAGARSALASLWAVNDAATARLIENFYAVLKANNSKSVSLQEAQQVLINTPEFEHPSNWAPFLLIGNWL